jgi:hypothetical protein
MKNVAADHRHAWTHSRGKGALLRGLQGGRRPTPQAVQKAPCGRTASLAGLDKALAFANDLFNALESAGYGRPMPLNGGGTSEPGGDVTCHQTSEFPEEGVETPGLAKLVHPSHF